MSYVLMVEDSVTDRLFIERILGKAFWNLEVRCANDPFEARELIAAQKPIGVLLDISLPKMSGWEFLGALMRSYPLPVIIVSGNCRAAGATSDELIKMGAMSVIEKPSSSADCVRFASELTVAIEAAFNFEATPSSTRRKTNVHRDTGATLSEKRSSRNATSVGNEVDVIAIGSSTGGPQALNGVLSVLPVDCPPVVIAQHIPANFVASLVERLNANSRLNVVQAHDKVRLQRGHAYVASPLSHLEIDSSLRTRLVDRGDDRSLSPSIDNLFRSLAGFAPRRVIACILTGMGNDGAQGMLELRRRGGRTIAQDESTSAVFGMPARAAECEAAEKVLPIDEIPACILGWCSERRVELALQQS